MSDGQKPQGFMAPPRNLGPAEIAAIERFAARVGIGPLFRTTPLHDGHHGWGCEPCARARSRRAKKPRQPRQPWEGGSS